MSPIKKRARIRSDEKTQPTDVVPITTSPETTSSSIQSIVADLLNEIEKFKGDPINASSLKAKLLQLKGLQRQLYGKLSTQKSLLDRTEKMKQTRFRDEAALAYERNYLESEINKCKSFQMKNLIHLAQAEVDEDPSNPSSVDSNISTFLNHSNVNNPEEKVDILATLHQQLESRGLLEKELDQKKEELKNLTSELKLKKDFLNNLPGQLQTIERASQPLVKFLTKFNSNTITNKMSGKDRLNRLETAQLLAPPLYTLFSLLQHYIDRVEVDDNKNVESKLTLKVIATEKTKELLQQHNQQVILLIPVVDMTSKGTVSTTSNKRVSIIFRYFPQLSVVTAQAGGCGTTLNQDILLDELFPGDSMNIAETFLRSKVEMIRQMEIANIDSTPEDKCITPTGSPFQWCNVLAGLYHAPPSGADDYQQNKQIVLVHSTRVVVSELMRRTRANSLLKFMLNSLMRNQMPIMPLESLREATRYEFKWKLMSFAPTKNGYSITSGSKDTLATFRMSMQHGPEEIQAEVELHMSRYPAVPPKWKFHFRDEECPLYDTRTAQLEQRINTDLLNEAPAILNESFCEWILIHQIHEIMIKWDDWIEQQKANNGNEVLSGRKFKGRDHTFIS